MVRLFRFVFCLHFFGKAMLFNFKPLLQTI